MNVVALSCPQCGGTQEVPGEDEFLTCTYCQVRLKVTRDDKGWLVKLLDATQQENRKLEAENEVLRLRNAIQQLDTNWETLRRSMLVKTKSGEREPSVSWGQGAILGGFVGPIAALLLLTQQKTDSGVWVILVCAGLAVVFHGLTELSKAREFNRLKASYGARRSELYDRLSAAIEALKRARPTPAYKGS